MPQVNWMIAGDSNRDPSTITSTVDRELANRIRVVFPTSATQASGGTIDYAITGNLNRQQAYTPPLLAAILMLASLRSHIVSDHFQQILENFRTFNMKKNYYFVFYIYNFSLCNSYWRFERFYRNGFYKKLRNRNFFKCL